MGLWEGSQPQQPYLSKVLSCCEALKVNGSGMQSGESLLQ